MYILLYSMRFDMIHEVCSIIYIYIILLRDSPYHHHNSEIDLTNNNVVSTNKHVNTIQNVIYVYHSRYRVHDMKCYIIYIYIYIYVYTRTYSCINVQCTTTSYVYIYNYVAPKQ
jgi:hypothetical protein